MKWNEVFCHTFKELRKHIEPEVSRPSDFMLPSFPMIEACRANDFDFFLPFLDSGRLTIEDMHHAAERYHLGKTRSGQPVFWMIDDMLQPLDRRQYDIDITVDPILENHATAAQKERCIDILEFLIEN
jgi:hypothetical protein